MPSEIMKRFYNYDWDIILLARKYGEEIKLEQKQANEIKKKSIEAKNKSRKMRRGY